MSSIHYLPAMGRPKNFSREAVLEQTIPLFWKNGFTSTGVREIELATGVNKSGLYAEFNSKEDLFLAALRHYLEHRRGGENLRAEPLGWRNIDSFLREAPNCVVDQWGCFSINSMRELPILPEQAGGAMEDGRQRIQALLRPNVAAEQPKMGIEPVCELIAVFFSGICIELNLRSAPSRAAATISNFMAVLRTA